MDAETREIVLSDLDFIVSTINRASGPSVDREIFWLIRKIVEAGKQQELFAPAYKIAKANGAFDDATEASLSGATAPHALLLDPSSPHTDASS